MRPPIVAITLLAAGIIALCGCRSPASELKPGAARECATDGAAMVYVPRAEFEMGSEPAEVQAVLALPGV